MSIVGAAPLTYAAIVTFIALAPVLERETVEALWAPASTIDATKWVELEKEGTKGWEFEERKVTFGRDGDTDFIVPEPGTYRLRLVDRSFTGQFQSELAVSETLQVVGVIPDPHKVKNFPQEGSKVVFLGDSIVEGRDLLPEQTLPAQLGAMTQVEVINAGKHADTTEQMLMRLETDVFPHNPDLIPIFGGWNDYRTFVPRETTFRNLREIIRRSQEKGAMVVIVGFKKPFFDDFEREFRKLSDEMGAGYVPNVLFGLEEISEFWDFNTFHPNAAGYRVMAERIAPAVRKLLAIRLRMSIQRANDRVVLSWPTFSGKTYRLRETSDFNVWTETLFIGTGQPMETLKPLSPKRFFTVVEE